MRKTTRTPETPDTGGEPRPEPIRFYGTTWVDHSGGYALRRAGLALGALAAAALGALLLRFAYEGVALSDIGSWASLLLVVAFALCSAMAFTRTLSSYSRRPDETAGKDAAAESSMRSIRAIGFVGVLLAYALRSCVEAPGEKLLRGEYEEARARYERRRTARTGNPAAKAKAKKKRGNKKQ
ncbi:membrane protein [Streptomyces albiaxialis]|uniref:Membrane protein n=1 Tax=Streptomyces albiaxialis TaxID=329523 RepID=A0ABN2X489_9ACTN